MTALIDLRGYLKEVSAFAQLAESFVDKTSSLGLKEVEGNLSRHVSAGEPRFTWSTRNAIDFNPSTKYDGPTKSHRPTRFKLSFVCDFERPAKARRQCGVWNLTQSATHVQIEREGGGCLKFHFDYKNAPQWGPQMHFQVHEDVGGLPIPRIMTGAFLPTDCADLMLSELHPDAWQKRQHQTHSRASVAELRKGQQNRTLTYAADIVSQWKTNQFTCFSMLQGYSASLALPDSAGRVAKKEW